MGMLGYMAASHPYTAPHCAGANLPSHVAVLRDAFGAHDASHRSLASEVRFAAQRIQEMNGMERLRCGQSSVAGNSLAQSPISPSVPSKQICALGPYNVAVASCVADPVNKMVVRVQCTMVHRATCYWCC